MAISPERIMDEIIRKHFDGFFEQEFGYRFNEFKAEGGTHMTKRIDGVETLGIDLELFTTVCNCFRWEGHGQGVRWIKELPENDPGYEDGGGSIILYGKDGLPSRSVEVYPGDWICCHPTDEVLFVMTDDEFKSTFHRHGDKDITRAEALNLLNSMQRLAFLLIKRYGDDMKDDKGNPFKMVEISESEERDLDGKTARISIEKSFEKMASLVCAIGG